MAMSVSGDWASEAANLPSALREASLRSLLPVADLVVERDFDRLQVVFVRDGFHLRALDFLELGFLLVHPAADQRAYSGSETRADRCSDGRALAASGHRADSRAGYGASASADRGALSRFAHVLECRASGRQQRGRHHGCHGSFGRSHRRIVLFYLTIVSSRSGPTEMILTGTPVSRSMNSMYSLS